jgi:hypothetical protein
MPGFVRTLCLLFAIIGCSDPGPAGTTGTTGTGTTSGGTGGTTGTTSGGTGGTTGTTSGGTTGGLGSPTILSYGTNVTTISPDVMVTFTAVLTDPMGIDNLAGGSLTSPDGSIQYGPFAIGAQKGAYAITLTWDQVNQAQTINFATSQIRTFVGTFFNAQGGKVSRSTTLTLTCKGLVACSGSCVDLSSSDGNCGSCGNKCVGGGSCASGKCSCSGAGSYCPGPGCVNLETDSQNCGQCGKSCAAPSMCSQGVCAVTMQSTNRQTCDSVCGAIGLSCRPGAGFSTGEQANYQNTGSSSLACNVVPSATAPVSGTPFVSVWCNCE